MREGLATRRDISFIYQFVHWCTFCHALLIAHLFSVEYYSGSLDNWKLDLANWLPIRMNGYGYQIVYRLCGTRMSLQMDIIEIRTTT